MGWLREWYNTYGAVTTFGGGVIWIRYSDWLAQLTPSEWAAWTGSIFTGLAFAGTIYLATKADRDRAKEKADTAVVFAASLIERVGWAIHILERLEVTYAVALVEAGSGDASEYQRTKFISFATRAAEAFAECPEFTVDEVKAIIVLPNRTAAHLAAAMQRVSVMKSDIRLIPKENLRTGLSAVTFIQRQREAIAGCIYSLKRARREFQTAIAEVNRDLELHDAGNSNM